MKRQLTSREKVLLCFLAVVALVSGYLMLFYTPMTQKREAMLAEIDTCRTQTEIAQIRLAEKQRMERELEKLFENDPPPRGLAPYDNSQAVMLELHRILSTAEDYSLAFSTVESEESIVRRSISLTFTSSSYEGAKAILQQLHDSMYRCLLSDITISIGSGDQGSVSTNSTIVFFEYQAAA